jgi:hypothetical protein
MMRAPIEGDAVTNSIWPTIHAERRSLAEDLADLTQQQWATQSLCSEWNVHQVLAHQLTAAKMTPPKFFLKFAAAGFNFDKYAAKEVAINSAGGSGGDFGGVPRGRTAGDGAAWAEGDLAG